MRSRIWQIALPVLTILLLVAISFGFTVWARRVGLLRPLEFRVYDRWMKARPNGQPQDSPCVIIELTTADIQQWKGYPITDGVMAKLLGRLLEAKPAAVGLDIYRDYKVGDDVGHALLIELFKTQTNVIVPVLINEDPAKDISQPIEAFPSVMHPQVGAVNTIEDPDRVVRRGLLSRYRSETSDDFALTLGCRLALTYLNSSNFTAPSGAPSFNFGENWVEYADQTLGQYQPGDGAYIGNERAGGQEFLLDFRGPREFEHYTVGDVLNRRVPPERLAGRVLLVGVCAKDVKDEVITPLRQGEDIEYGVAYHARLIDQMIRGARGENVRMRVWPDSIETRWILLFCILGALVAYSARPPWRFMAGTTGMALATSLSTLVLAGLWFGARAAFARNWWIPVVPPAAAFLMSGGLVALYNAIIGRRDRSAMMQLIGQCVSDDIAKLIWSERDDIFARGRIRARKLRGTVLFTDLKGFSTISEQLEAPQLMRWLNQYFDGLSDLVKQSGGLIMKFNGDQIVAVFGPPRARSVDEAAVDAGNAVRCALRMREKMVVLNERWRKSGKPQAAMRVGIHTGWLVAGSLGSRQRLEWTVIGDTVNTASRLESVKKDLMPPDIAANGCRILISRATARLLPDRAFDIRPLGRLRLKGKARRVLVYGVKGLITNAPGSGGPVQGSEDKSGQTKDSSCDTEVNANATEAAAKAKT